MRKNCLARAAFFLLCLGFFLISLTLVVSCHFMSLSESSASADLLSTDGSSAESDDDGEGDALDLEAESLDESQEDTVEVDRAWTILVYMAADNDLESHAIADINEMERAILDPEITVLALVDRGAGYDYSNGNWTDTRLYEISYDKEDCGSIIVSKEVDCPDLELYTSTSTELDMGSRQTLENVLAFIQKSYDAEHYALIMWGHGSGWRSGGGEDCEAADGAQAEKDDASEADGASGTASQSLFRAFSIDDTSQTTLSLVQMSSAIQNAFSSRPLDFLGMDTCFGVSLEIAFQLKDSVSFLAGTPALVPCGGWNYEALLTDFSASSRTSEDLCAISLSQFSKLYSYYSYACFSAIDCRQVSSMADSFDSFCADAAALITDY